jgi:DNA-binding response OmpR family regulator
MAKILLIGLETTLADELSRVLSQLGQSVQTLNLDSDAAETGDIQLIFAPEAELVSSQRTHPGVPVIVVSRVPEVSSWLHALEQGAADYCGTPFEARQIRWALNSSLAPTNRIAA